MMMEIEEKPKEGGGGGKKNLKLIITINLIFYVMNSTQFCYQVIR